MRTVATGGTALDSAIVEALVRPVTKGADLTDEEVAPLGRTAEGKQIKAIAVAGRVRQRPSTTRWTLTARGPREATGSLNQPCVPRLDPPTPR